MIARKTANAVWRMFNQAVKERMGDEGLVTLKRNTNLKRVDRGVYQAERDVDVFRGPGGEDLYDVKAKVTLAEGKVGRLSKTLKAEIN